MPATPYTNPSLLEDRLRGRRSALDGLRALPDDYQLYYNPSPRGQTGVDRNDPAIDCIIAHKGLLGVTVKTGEIVEEPGGFISQYQPQKQLYKIIDPVKPADAALRQLFHAFDPSAPVLYPCGVAVLFPDTQRHEFSTANASYLFADDMEQADFADKLDVLFLEPADSGDRAKFAANFNRLVQFLKDHSDNAAIFQQRRQQIMAAKQVSKPIEAPVSTNLRMKVAQPPVVRPPEVEVEVVEDSGEAIKTELKARVQKAIAEKKPMEKLPPPIQRSKKEMVAAALASPVQLDQDKPLEIAKAEKAMAAIALPRRSLREMPVQASRQKDMFTWLEEVQEKGEGDAMLTPLQWTMAVGIAVGVIAIAYFISAYFAA